MMRKAKNSGATGGANWSAPGVSGANASMPFTSPSGSCVSIRLASLGTSMAKSLWRVSAFGSANSTSGAPRSVFHSASIAAIFAGWCSSVFNPCRSPAKICSGAITAAITTPVRSVRSAEASAGARSSLQADSPARAKDAVSPEASSTCVMR